MATARVGLFILCLAALPLEVGAQAGTTQGNPPTGLTVAGGIAGSALGLVGGAKLGYYLSRTYNWEAGSDDPGLLGELAGGFAGSLLGSALGATLGSRLEGQRQPSFGRRMRDALVGTIIGLGAFALASRVSDEPEPGIIAFSVAQGLYVGISNGRW